MRLVDRLPYFIRKKPIIKPERDKPSSVGQMPNAAIIQLEIVPIDTKPAIGIVMLFQKFFMINTSTVLIVHMPVRGVARTTK